jgi:hypothetical protein
MGPEWTGPGGRDYKMQLDRLYNEFFKKHRDDPSHTYGDYELPGLDKWLRITYEDYLK